jgi:hypothetical protein
MRAADIQIAHAYSVTVGNINLSEDEYWNHILPHRKQSVLRKAKR